jgi:DNA-binding LacI/PurR family transcriptional regulator
LIDGKSVSAIVCGGFEISNGALNACLTNGLQLSRDLSFIGYGDPSYYRWMSGGISTIRVRPEEFAEKTAELIAQQQPSESDNEPHQWLKAELVVR